jgi:hypothetical protein
MSENLKKRLDRIGDKIRPIDTRPIESLTDAELLEIIGFDHEPTDEELMDIIRGR